MVTKERRSLGMHPKLLFDTIKRQAGTLEKANTEAVMNSIEAGAAAVYCTISVDAEGKATMHIIDDGEGIDTKEDMIAHFETFGTPHDESENTHWKQFRMGRGQLFAFGRNIWRTATFEMTVDINKWGLEYDLKENLPFVDGCEITIELYKNPIGNWPYPSMERYKEALTKQVRFVNIPCYFNDEQINTPADDCDWDLQDKNAYYLFNVGTEMTVYNLGIYVQDISAYDVGMGGIAVSKKQLKVNFARNDVISDCPVMGHINKILEKHRIKKSRRTRRNLNQFERKSTLQDLRDNIQRYQDIKTLGLIPTAQGKYISLEVMRKNRLPWSFSNRGDRLADRIMQREQAICIDENILADLNYTGKKSQFFLWLVGQDNKIFYGNNDWHNVTKLYTPFSKLSEGVSDTYIVIPDKKLTVSERRILKVLQSFDCWRGRVLRIGGSEMADAWTDGSTYITIDRNFLKKLYLGSGRGVNELMMVMAHEMAHDEDTACTHYHGPEFYENMVNVLKGSYSPTIWSATFYSKMERSKIEERRAAERAAEIRKKEKIDKKLGIKVPIAASEKKT